MSDKPKRGRPPLGVKTANTKLPTVRVTDDQLASFKECAELEGKTLAGWIRVELERAVSRIRRKHSK